MHAFPILSILGQHLKPSYKAIWNVTPFMKPLQPTFHPLPPLTPPHEICLFSQHGKTILCSLKTDLIICMEKKNSGDSLCLLFCFAPKPQISTLCVFLDRWCFDFSPIMENAVQSLFNKSLITVEKSKRTRWWGSLSIVRTENQVGTSLDYWHNQERPDRQPHQNWNQDRR